MRLPSACVITLPLAAGVLDGLDGPVARALHATSRFGAELDSLCDLVSARPCHCSPQQHTAQLSSPASHQKVNFGVAPTFLVYLWRFAELGWSGWLLSLVWCSCMACRLARFNAGVDFNQAVWSRNYFMVIA